jgi:hypothetical protein
VNQSTNKTALLLRETEVAGPRLTEILEGLGYIGSYNGGSQQ